MSGAKKKLVHGLFTPVAEQIVRVREWNKKFGWGFSEEVFAVVEKSIPAWPKKKLATVVLVPYLVDPHHTFRELWMRAKAVQKESRADSYDKFGSDRLRLLKGIDHPSTSSGRAMLRWEVIDLGCNRGKLPLKVRSVKSPHAGILAAAALHPNWVKNMDGDKLPYVCIPGYEVNSLQEDPWADVLSIRFYRSEERRIRLICSQCNTYSSHEAVPSFFRE